MASDQMHTFDQQELQALFEHLQSLGYEIVGPTIRDSAIVYDTLNSTADLPIAWTDRQEAGHYRLKRRNDKARFGYTVGPHSWKKYLLPPRMLLWDARRDENSLTISDATPPPRKLALIGVRACELHALAVQDRVLVEGACADPYYKGQRDNLFIVAVQCGQAGKTCFCASMETGPKATEGFDLALTEVIEGGDHYFVVETGSPAGGEVLAALPHRRARKDERATAECIIANTQNEMGRRLDTAGLQALLYKALEHPRWNDVAERCLTCGNCTAVCPTCFCTTVEEVTDLSGEHSEHWRRWDSCFTMDFSFVHGEGSVRASGKSRYRQWMTHKLATWIDQFGTSGCVGCGRCITWCPAGIDITVEVQAIRENPIES